MLSRLLGIALPIFTEEDRSLIYYTLNGITKIEGIGSIIIFSRIPIKLPSGVICVVDRNLSIKSAMKSLCRYKCVVLCRMGVQLIDGDWILKMKRLIEENPVAVIGCVCQSLGTKIRGYNKNLLSLSPIPLGEEVKEEGDRVEIVRYVLGTTGSNLRKLLENFTDKGYDWDVQLSERADCLVSNVVADVSKANRKLNFRKL